MAKHLIRSADHDSTTDARVAALLKEHQYAIWQRTDRLFAGLLVFEWMAGIVLALSLSPRTWSGTVSQIHPHVYAAIFFGAAIISLPVYLAFAFAGRTFTRHIIAISQMLFAALLIHIGEGRVEMHFHIFGSLAFLAFYRDWRVLVTASLVVTLHHLLGGIYLPASVYGVFSAPFWRSFEHAGWVIFEDIFLIASCIQGVREMSDIATRQALLEHSHRTVEDKVRERTQQLKTAQEELLKIARSAGMAEIATSVLHNVGNVLNSVNVSLSVATTKVQQSPVGDLAKAIDMLSTHKSDFAAFITHDERGRHIPAFLETVSGILSEEQTSLLEEMSCLSKNVDHIKQIIAVQQSHAKTSEVIEEIEVARLLEDAVSVNTASLESNHIRIVREFADVPAFTGDKHAILQILINLLANAKHAVMGNPQEERQITIRTELHQENNGSTVRISVRDNGVGITPENINKVFTYGFTTKKDGHGFGLHASANTAKKLHGSLSAQSDGPNCGAVFTLELPLSMEQVTA